jgi:hypothetical protein
VNRLLRPRSYRTDGVDFLVVVLGLAGIAATLSADDGGDIALVGQSTGIDDGNAQPDPDSVDVVPGVDVVEGHHDEVKLPEEGYFQLLDIGVIGVDFQVGVESQNRLPGHQSLRHALVLPFEQELPVQVANLPYSKLTSMVSMSRMCTSPTSILASTFSISQPMPPTPTISTLTSFSCSLAL